MLGPRRNGLLFHEPPTGLGLDDCLRMLLSCFRKRTSVDDIGYWLDGPDMDSGIAARIIQGPSHALPPVLDNFSLI